MPTYRHPLASEHIPGNCPKQVHVARDETVSVDSDGYFEAPRPVAEAIAGRFGLGVGEIEAEPQGSTPESGDESPTTTDESGDAPEECGEFIESTSDDCGRDPGWGTDSDTGPCTDHLPD